MNRKGTAMVEAAVVFPMVILTVMALIYMFQIFFRETEIRADMHKALRAESGKCCQTLQYQENIQSPFPIYRKGERLYCRGTLQSKERGILKAGEKMLYSDKYLDDERNFIRKIDLIPQREFYDE